MNLEGGWCLGCYQWLDHSDADECPVQCTAVDAVQLLILAPKPGCPCTPALSFPSLSSRNCPFPSGLRDSGGCSPCVSWQACLRSSCHFFGLLSAHLCFSGRAPGFPRPRLPSLRVVAERARDRSVALGCPPIDGTWNFGICPLPFSVAAGPLASKGGEHPHCYCGFFNRRVGRARKRQIGRSGLSAY